MDKILVRGQLVNNAKTAETYDYIFDGKIATRVNNQLKYFALKCIYC